MGRADPAGGEDVIEPPAHLVDRGDDDLGHVGNDPRLAQPDPGLVEPAGKKAQILVLGAARQDLVADDQHAGGDDPGLGSHAAGIGIVVAHSL